MRQASIHGPRADADQTSRRTWRGSGKPPVARSETSCPPCEVVRKLKIDDLAEALLLAEAVVTIDAANRLRELASGRR